MLKSLLSRGSFFGLLPLTGLTDIPLIRSDGTLLDKPGYDAASGILYLPSDILIDIPKNPTLDDAKNAVIVLEELIKDFPFVATTDRAVAISAFVSACCRPTLGPTPLHAFSAPTPRTGKGLLVSLVSIVATGGEPGRFVMRARDDDDELKKCLATQLLKGRRIISIDNVIGSLGGAAICSFLTEQTQSIRILGQSKDSDIVVTSFFLTNGNNLCLADDLNPRSVLCLLDANTEHPEERVFDFDARKVARTTRGKYVSACLTIVRAHHAGGSPSDTIPLGGFEAWSRRVRDALIWTGLPDPCGNKNKLRENDPDLGQFLALAELWKDKIDGRAKASEIVEEAERTGGEFKTIFMAVAGKGPLVDSSRLGRYFKKYRYRPIGRFKLTCSEGRAHSTLWRLRVQNDNGTWPVYPEDPEDPDEFSKRDDHPNP